jgi:hypothetical protein
VPTFYVDVTDIFMTGRRARVVTAVAGALVHLVLGSLWFIVALLSPLGSFTQAFAAASGIIQWQAFVIALYPFCFIEMDGYHVPDMLGELTKAESLAYGVFRGATRGRSCQQALYLAYVGLSALSMARPSSQREADPPRDLVRAAGQSPPPRAPWLALTRRRPPGSRCSELPRASAGRAASFAWARDRSASPARWASSATTAKAMPTSVGGGGTTETRPDSDRAADSRARALQAARSRVTGPHRGSCCDTLLRG